MRKKIILYLLRKYKTKAVKKQKYQIAAVLRGCFKEIEKLDSF